MSDDTNNIIDINKEILNKKNNEDDENVVIKINNDDNINSHKLTLTAPFSSLPSLNENGDYGSDSNKCGSSDDEDKNIVIHNYLNDQEADQDQYQVQEADHDSSSDISCTIRDWIARSFRKSQKYCTL